MTRHVTARLKLFLLNAHRTMEAMMSKIPWEFHFKALIQAKGFLKIIQFVLAIITFSILAGYTAETAVGLCVSTPNVNRSVDISSPYPFDTMTISTTIYNSSEPKSLQITARAGDAGISRQAMLFVAWGVITLFYCIVAVGIYVSTMAKADDLGKIYTGLVYTDLGFTLFWCFMWLVVSAEWASGQYGLLKALQGAATSSADCAVPAAATIIYPDILTLLQSNIAVVFGFLNLFVWLANIWWVLIDCPAYMVLRDKMCPGRARPSYDAQ